MPISPYYLQPEPGEYPAYYDGYYAQLPDVDVFELLARQTGVLAALLMDLSEEQQLFRYANGKWSIKEVIGHLVDTERIFSYRGLRILRGDMTPLPGYDQDKFVGNSEFDNRSMNSLLGEFGSLRASNILLLEGHPHEVYKREGVASEHRITLRAIIVVLAAHVVHHVAILNEHYLGD